MKKIILIASLFFLFQFVNAVCNSGQIDINSASLTDLDKLSGIGPAKAQSIIDSRPFGSLDDLLNVSGIGEATLSKIKSQDLACVNSGNSEDVANEETKDKEVDNLNMDEEKPAVDKVNSSSDLVEEINAPISTTETIINLNSENIPKEKVVYESKNGRVIKYLPYAFALFIVFLIIIVLLKR